MSYFRKMPRLHELMDIFSRSGRWLICISADPDAMASALALQRIMSRRVMQADIASANEVSRLDNLSMMRYLRIPVARLSPELLPRYDHFAIVDSQPHHNPQFDGIPFSVIIDHHPPPEDPFPAEYSVIKPEYGATSTLFAEILYNLHLRPGKLLATALQFGIKTDTNSFARHCGEADLRAYHYLAKFADQALLARIVRSEFHRSWLAYFAKACVTMLNASPGERLVHVGDVASPDILVAIADFFMRFYGINWVAVSGIFCETVVVIYRGEGVRRNMGRLAGEHFGDIGSAGGHPGMARAEFPVSALAGADVELFIHQRILGARQRRSP